MFDVTFTLKTQRTFISESLVHYNATLKNIPAIKITVTNILKKYFGNAEKQKESEKKSFKR